MNTPKEPVKQLRCGLTVRNTRADELIVGDEFIFPESQHAISPTINQVIETSLDKTPVYNWIADFPVQQLKSQPLKAMHTQVLKILHNQRVLSP